MKKHNKAAQKRVSKALRLSKVNTCQKEESGTQCHTRRFYVQIVRG